MTPFYGFNCLKATESLRGDSLLFTTKSPGVPGVHLIDLGMMNGWVDLETTGQLQGQLTFSSFWGPINEYQKLLET